MIMKSIRKQLEIISLFIAFLVLLVSCEQYEEDSSIPNNLSDSNSFYTNLDATFLGNQHNLILIYILFVIYKYHLFPAVVY